MTLHRISQNAAVTHQLQAERAAVGRGVVHGVVTLFVPHPGIGVVPQQVLHAPGGNRREVVGKQSRQVSGELRRGGAYFPSVSAAAA